jgi:hypothetical protein
LSGVEFRALRPQTQLTAGRLNVVPLFAAGVATTPASRRCARTVPVPIGGATKSAFDGIVRNQIDLLWECVPQFCQLTRLFVGVVDAVDKDIFEKDLLSSPGQ